MIEVIPRKIGNTAIAVPGSKSYTHRIYIAAALSDGLCKIRNFLESEDTNYTLTALKKMGIQYKKEGDQLCLSGLNGKFKAYDKPIDLGNSGTSMRLLSSLAGIGQGSYLFTGSERMCLRPIGHLLEALNQMGFSAVSINNDDCPPVKVISGKISKSNININCSVSSQYLSALLLISPFAQDEVHLHITHGPVSKPYVDMTIDIMAKFGVSVVRNGYSDFFIRGKQAYLPGNYDVEPDCSQAGYFWAAAAITGSEVKVKKITKESKQGDARFPEVLSAMGCHVNYRPDGISVIGGELSAIEVDMADMPDLVPTLAIVASFAKGTTYIKNVGHLRAKESDRLAAVTKELGKMGISAISNENDLIITGGKTHGAEIETYNDHRIAMSFAIAGLMVPGIKITDEHCVDKSFPDFWKVLDELR